MQCYDDSKSGVVQLVLVGVQKVKVIYFGYSTYFGLVKEFSIHTLTKKLAQTHQFTTFTNSINE